VRVWGSLFSPSPPFPLAEPWRPMWATREPPQKGFRCLEIGPVSRGFPAAGADSAVRANESVGDAATPDQRTRWRWKADRIVDLASSGRFLSSVALPQPLTCTSASWRRPSVPWQAGPRRTELSDAPKRKKKKTRLFSITSAAAGRGVCPRGDGVSPQLGNSRFFWGTTQADLDDMFRGRYMNA
jgi:hypothetical protein